MIQILALYLDFKGAKNIHALQVLVSSFEKARGTWIGVDISIQIWSLVFDTPMFQILTLYIDFKDAKNFHVL